MSLSFSLSGPTIEEFPADTHAIEGEGIVFKVMVRGNPQPSLTWYHQDAQLTSDYSMELQEDGSLLIASTELKHSGVYRLSAKNSKGSVEREVTLTVRADGDEAADEVTDKVEVQPVSVAEFGDYVAQAHANSNRTLKQQYRVYTMLAVL